MTAVIPDQANAAHRDSALLRPTALTDDVIDRYLAGDTHAEHLIPEPEWGPNGEIVFTRTYAMLTADGGKETWAQTCRRVVLGNLAFDPGHHYLPNEARDLFRAMYTFGILPAGRHLKATGTPIVASRNCLGSRFYPQLGQDAAWIAKILFLGGGVGSNYSPDLISIVPPVTSTITAKIACDPHHPDFEIILAAAGGNVLSPHDIDDLAFGPDTDTHTEILRVGDTREGWVEAWRELIARSGLPGAETIIFDVSGIRPKGAALVTMGGTASGPAPLVTAILGINAVTNGAVGRRLTGLEHMAIHHQVAAAVCSGGTRRSARLSLMHWTSPEIFDFIHVKQLAADGTMPHWTTNISIETDSEFAEALDTPTHALHGHARKVLDAVTVGMARNGEPGFVNTEAHSEGERTRIRLVNPCSEISLEPNEACLIGSVNVDHYGSDDDAIGYAVELLARFLYRATMHPYPDEEAAAVEARNRRIGLGILGLHGWVLAHGVKLTDLPNSAVLKNKLTRMRLLTRRAADQLADELGLPRPIKVTAVAPTGTISTLAGATPGVSPVIYKYFERRVRFHDTDPHLIDLQRQGYLVEDDRYAAHTKVVTFPTKDGILERFPEDLVEDSGDVTFDQHMAIVHTVQDTLLGGSDGNAVSSTAQIPAGTDPASLAEALLPYLRSNLKGITVFPELSMAQAPFQRLTEAAYEKALQELGESAAFYAAVGDSNSGENCATGACPV